MKRLMIAVLAICLLFSVGAVSAQPTISPVNTITVTGTGSASGSPDMATIEIGAEIVNQDLSTAFSESNETIDAIIAAIAETGVARQDIRTVDLNVFSQSPPPGAGSEATEYRVSNRVRVTVRAIDNIENAINAAVDAGANTIFGLNFSISDQTDLESEARSEAMENARQQAEELAGIIGAELGDVLIIHAGDSGSFPPIPFANGIGGMGGAASDAVVETGQLTLNMQVQVTYAITR